MTEIIYNHEHMKEIASKYDCAASEITEIINYFCNTPSVKEAIENNYQGQGFDVAADILGKIKQHLELLKNCCESTGEYVTISLETMAEAGNGQIK